jgi:hypothetical protein
VVVDPRTTNIPGIVEALELAGVTARWSGETSLEIAGTTLAVMPVKVVREKDAQLLAHLHDTHGRPPTIIVSDRISGAARAELSRVGLAWFDRRGHLWMREPGIFVNAEVPSTDVRRSRKDGNVLKGAGLDVALALLVSPREQHRIHELARLTNRSPGRVSEVLSTLRSQGLAGSDNRPVVPELFWAVSDEWRPRWEPTPSAPPPEPPRRFRLSGTLGALALGAPVVADVGRTWPRLYVADNVDLATVLHAYGATSGWTGAEVAVCPSRFGFTWGATDMKESYSVASHIVVALDLAQDRSRGREVLENWDPEGFSRVW